MTLPSPYIKGEFIPTDADPRAQRLQRAIGAKIARKAVHMTPAKARKYEALLSSGFDAETIDGGWKFVRNGRRLSLDHAIMAVEVMR